MNILIALAVSVGILAFSIVRLNKSREGGIEEYLSLISALTSLVVSGMIFTLSFFVGIEVGYPIEIESNVMKGDSVTCIEYKKIDGTPTAVSLDSAQAYNSTNITVTCHKYKNAWGREIAPKYNASIK